MSLFQLCVHILVSHCFICLLFTNIETYAEEIPDSRPYNITLLPVGVEITGIHLLKDVTKAVKQQIKEDLLKYQLLLFRNQGDIHAEKHVEIAKWFGKQIDHRHRQHEKAEHPLVFRISNDPKQGFTGVGHQGIHIVGYFNEKPHDVVLFHVVKVPREGKMVFVDLYKFVETMSTETKEKWDGVWMKVGDEPWIHPLVYPHPNTKQEVLAINSFFVDELIYNFKKPEEKRLGFSDEMDDFLDAMEVELRKNPDIMYDHKWQAGDFIILDNRAVAMVSDKDTQKPRHKVGLNVVHRVCVKGRTRPMKQGEKLEDYREHVLEIDVSDEIDDSIAADDKDESEEDDKTNEKGDKTEATKSCVKESSKVKQDDIPNNLNSKSGKSEDTPRLKTHIENSDVKMEDDTGKSEISDTQKDLDDPCVDIRTPVDKDVNKAGTVEHEGNTERANDKLNQDVKDEL